MSGSDPRSPIELSSDEDWKNRVKAEDAALDQQFDKKEPQAAPAAPTADQERPETGEPVTEKPQIDKPQGKRSDVERAEEGPEATFGALLGMLSNQAMLAMGLIADPATREPKIHLPVARYFIDLIAVLERTTAGNLDPKESALLDESLHSLRMIYIERSKEKKK